MEVNLYYLILYRNITKLEPSTNPIGDAMSEIRRQFNPTIMQLLREHDRLPYENVSERQSLQRKILHLMTTVKLMEFENQYAN